MDTAYLFKIEMASQLVSIAVMAIFGLFSTRLYKWHIFRKIKKLRERYTAGSPEYHDALIKQGGVNRKGIISALRCYDGIVYAWQYDYGIWHVLILTGLSNHFR